MCTIKNAYRPKNQMTVVVSCKDRSLAQQENAHRLTAVLRDEQKSE
jgi:hypothetical protein